MEKGCTLNEVLSLIIPLLSVFAALASAYAVFKANEIAVAVRRFQKNSILNQREIELLGRALEKLNIYDVWCKQDGSGSNVNYHNSNETEYVTRDDASNQIPRDIKFILIQLSSHSERLESLTSEWESDFIIMVANDYHIKDELVTEKIKQLRAILASGL